MEVFDQEYSIVYQPDNAIVLCRGSLSLNGSHEYEPIMNLLLAASQSVEQLTVDVRQLTFLNSSGINTFTKFVIHVRKQQNKLRLKIIGREAVVWQVKLSRNLQRLLPTLEIITE